jgi:ankyrin repeat protein
LQTTGVDPNEKDSEGNTALHVAAQFGQLAVVRLLIDNPGASWQILPNESNAAGETPLHLATQSAAPGKEELCGLLLKAFANPKAQTKAGWTPLHYVAAFNGSTALVDLLLDQGASPFLKNNAGETPLDLAAKETGGNPSIVPGLSRAMRSASDAAAQYGVS